MDEPRDEQSSQESSEGSTLPLEIIMYIMKKMPNKEKTNLMQTCKVLYSYGSELLSYRSPLVLHSDQLDDEFLVISITQSYRRFRQLRVNMKGLDGIKFFNLLRILEVHGRFIEKFTWDFWERNIMTPQEIFAILNKTPNISSLTVTGLRTFFLDDSWPEDASLHALTKLKTIDFHHVPKGFGKVLTKLPPNTVSILKFNGTLDDFADVLLYQSKTLEELVISEKCVDATVFRCLNLKRLFYCVSDDHIATSLTAAENRFLVDVIRNQPDLQQLLFCTHSAMFNIGGLVFETSVEVAQEIFKLANLESLELGPTQHSIQGISRLKKLKSLSIQDCDSLIWTQPVLRELSHVKFQSLERIDLFCCETQLTQNFFECLGRSCPNLKKLFATNDEIFTLNSFFNFFPKLEVLEVGCFKRGFYHYNYDGKVHANLKCLIIMNESSSSLLMRVSPSLFEALPSLNRVYIAAPVRYDIAVLRALHESRIEKFSIHFEYSEPELVFTTERDMIRDMKQKAKEFDITIEKQDFSYF